MAERVVPAHELLLHLDRLDGPVSTTQILEHVARSAAPTDVQATLGRLPDRQWRSVEDAVAAIGTGWSAASDSPG